MIFLSYDRALARVLSLPLSPSALTSETRALAANVGKQPTGLREASLAPAVINYLAALGALVREQYKEAFDKQMVRLITMSESIYRYIPFRAYMSSFLLP